MCRNGKRRRIPRHVQKYVRARDGNRCVLCNGRKHLTSHHAEGDPDDMRPEAMGTLCEGCHRCIEALLRLANQRLDEARFRWVERAAS